MSDTSFSNTSYDTSLSDTSLDNTSIDTTLSDTSFDTTLSDTSFDTLSMVSSPTSELSESSYFSDTDSSVFTGGSVSSMSSIGSMSTVTENRGFDSYNFFYKILALFRYCTYVGWFTMFLIDFGRNGGRRKRHENPNNSNVVKDWKETSFNDCFLSPGTHVFWVVSVLSFFLTNKLKVSNKEWYTVEVLNFLCLFILIPARRTQGVKYWDMFTNNSFETVLRKEQKPNFIMNSLRSLEHQDVMHELKDEKRPIVQFIQQHVSPPRPPTKSNSALNIDPVKAANKAKKYVKNILNMKN